MSLVARTEAVFHQLSNKMESAPRFNVEEMKLTLQLTKQSCIFGKQTSKQKSITTMHSMECSSVALYSGAPIQRKLVTLS